MSTANDAVQDIIAYQFNDLSLLTEALQAPGSPIRYAGTRAIPDGNKRLALLGDTVLELALLEHWYEGGSPRGAGHSYTEIEGNNNRLAMVARQHGLEAYVNNDPSRRGAVANSTLANTVEAILGAVYLDSNKDIDIVKAVMRIFTIGGV
ncbi:IMP-specific 5'-nucleotidase 1 [Physcia stellaris]|nr:IMP-specific 5'-nucleotidase 1 [Physcia stellaris]